MEWPTYDPTNLNGCDGSYANDGSDTRSRSLRRTAEPPTSRQRFWRQVFEQTEITTASETEMRLDRLVVLALPTVIAGAMALLVAALVPLLPTYAQNDAFSCAHGAAVPNSADNPGLVSDCEALLGARDTLAGSGSLNWSATIPIGQWDGVTVSRTSQRVTALSLRERELTGKVPSELGSLSELEVLSILGNELTGAIPGELGRLVNLESLSLSSKRLTGEIPPELAALSNLRWLDLGYSQLSGKIPPGIGKLSGLTFLSLASNQLDGPIPSELGNLSNLEDLRLYENQLSGEVPAELATLSNLTRLLFYDNQLNGKIPAELGSLSNLKALELGNNQLSGHIPPELANLSNLTHLLLGFNQLSGEIPPELASLSNLIALSLDRNQLDGPIPTELGKLSNLRSLNLDNNLLTGEIPVELADLSRLDWLSLSGNQLSGHIPPELSNLSNLRILQLQENELSGKIPSELADLSKLEWLILSGNQLSGHIPPELSYLSNLTLLRLQDNELSGEIPRKLLRLSSLAILRLANNKLTGCIPVPPLELRALDEQDLYLLGLPFCSVLLSDLVVSPGSLAPSFDRFQTDYVARVGAQIVTVLPSNYDNATFKFLNQYNDEIADADANMPGFQINIGAGVTTIRIIVVAGADEAIHTYTVRIRFVLGPPTIRAVEAGGGYLTVSWDAPDELAGLKVANYDLRYIRTTDDETMYSNWTVSKNVWTDFTGDNPLRTITNLSAGTQYEVQVRAVDSDGDPGFWSATATGVPKTASVCVTGGAVTEVTNTSIISDCEALLAARDALVRNGSLNWSPDTPMKDWDGVTVDGTPLRVVNLAVNSRGLDGTIPANLGNLASLQRLELFENRLTGPIPAELGRLANLQELDLSENRLTGPIPAELGRLANLQELDLSENRLTGPIPAELGRLANLQKLDLSDNRLTGGIPSQLGRLAHLGSLLLHGNELSGVIPLELGEMHRLVEVDLFSNSLRGCAPPIRNVRVNQMAEHGGPPCFAVEGTAFTVGTPYLLADAALSITAAGDAVNGVVTLDGATITYEHDGSETTTGSFTYTVTDGTLTATTLVTVAVSPANDPPLLASDTLAVQEGNTVSVQVQELLANDSDAERDALSITAVGDAVNGVVTLDGATITYRHDGSETTTGSFTYTVTDGTETGITTVAITVASVNDPPVAVSDTATMDEGGTLSIETLALLQNDTDAENDPLSITAVWDSVNGTVSLDGATITYEHDGSETTTGSFTYTVTDGTLTATALVTVAVSPANDPPLLASDTLAVQEGNTVSVQVQELLANDSDAERDALSITAVGDAVNGVVTLDGATITYRHDGSETTTGSFTYTVTDGTETGITTVAITVASVNDPPVAVSDTATMDEGGTLSIETLALLQNDTDAENDPLSITAVWDSVNGTVSLDGTTITYEHDGSETTTGGFTHIVSDGAETASAMVTIEVTPVNDLPVVPLIALALGVGLMAVVVLVVMWTRRPERLLEGPSQETQ